MCQACEDRSMFGVRLLVEVPKCTFQTSTPSGVDTKELMSCDLCRRDRMGSCEAYTLRTCVVKRSRAYV